MSYNHPTTMQRMIHCLHDWKHKTNTTSKEAFVESQSNFTYEKRINRWHISHGVMFSYNTPIARLYYGDDNRVYVLLNATHYSKTTAMHQRTACSHLSPWHTIPVIIDYSLAYEPSFDTIVNGFIRYLRESYAGKYMRPGVPIHTLSRSRKAWWNINELVFAVTYMIGLCEAHKYPKTDELVSGVFRNYMVIAKAKAQMGFNTYKAFITQQREQQKEAIKRERAALRKSAQQCLATVRKTIGQFIRIMQPKLRTTIPAQELLKLLACGLFVSGVQRPGKEVDSAVIEFILIYFKKRFKIAKRQIIFMPYDIIPNTLLVGIGNWNIPIPAQHPCTRNIQGFCPIGQASAGALRQLAAVVAGDIQLPLYSKLLPTFILAKINDVSIIPVLDRTNSVLKLYYPNKFNKVAEFSAKDLESLSAIANNSASDEDINYNMKIAKHLACIFIGCLFNEKSYAYKAYPKLSSLNEQFKKLLIVCDAYPNGSDL